MTNNKYGQKITAKVAVSVIRNVNTPFFLPAGLDDRLECVCEGKLTFGAKITRYKQKDGSDKLNRH